MKLYCDFLIIGGGIVGLSIGRELLKTNPKSKVIVVEKESRIGEHASGRNSGVLHAGFYYSPDSLKAQFCLKGNFALKALIEKHNLPIKKCGKVVIAKNEDDIPRMEDLFQRGKSNGVDLQQLSASKLNKYEPLAKTYKQFLWSPNTAISNPRTVNDLIMTLFTSEGGVVLVESRVLVSADGRVFLNNEEVRSERVINASGTQAIHIAQRVGAGIGYSQLPVLGIYKQTESKALPLRTLVYPVPNPKNPFLGTHFTLTLDGHVKIGPTAIPILGREQYGIRDLPDWLDLHSTSKAIFNLFQGSPLGLANLAYTELPKIATSRLMRDGSELLTSMPKSIKWKQRKPGIRAQLVNLEKKSFEMDFVVETNKNFVHVLNAVSPGWTSAIPFAQYIVKKYVS